MDVHFYLQEFESFMRMRFGGDDPLDAWDKFVDFLETHLPPEEKCNMGVVIERLVKNFVEDVRYHNDLRFLNYCIRCASTHPDPVEVYSQVHRCGVGMQMAALYVSWAQEFERRDLKAQAEQVYQKAFENQAEPLDTLQHHYRLFQSRTGGSQMTDSAAVSTLQEFLLINQPLHQRDGVRLQSEGVVDSQAPVYRTIISRSENNPPPNRSSTTKCVSMYCVKELVCEGSALTFEELRAQRYFTKLREQKLDRQKSEVLRRCLEKEQEVIQLKKQLEELDLRLGDEAHLEQPIPECESREKPHTECPTGIQQHETLQSDAVEEAEGYENTDLSCGGINHSRITPNSSLGLISATPSRALPSPTVNTREALDVIGNMFQGPTLLQDTLFNATHSDTPAEEDRFERNYRVTGFATPSVPSSVPFRIYQDENENKSVEPHVVKKPKTTPLGALMEIPISKTTVPPLGLESLTDDSTMWGPGHAPMTFFPNHTQDLSLSAHIASTPLHTITPHPRDSQHSQVGSRPGENLHLHQPAKLSPILEQSPSEMKQCDVAVFTLRAQGTITGECVSLQEHAHSLTQSNQTNTSISRQAIAPLHAVAAPAFPDQSIAPTKELRSRTWSIYQSPSGEMEKGDGASGGDLKFSSLLCNMNRKLNSSSLEMVKEHKSVHTNSQEELNLTSLQHNSSGLHKPYLFSSNSSIWLREESDMFPCNSNAELFSSKLSKPLHRISDTELHSHSQNPVRDVNPGKLELNQEFSTSRLCPSGELPHKKLNYSSLNILQELKPDRVNLIHSQLSDMEDANVPPERSFIVCRSSSLLLEGYQVQQRKSCMAIRDVPMSPDQPAKPDLDEMAESPPQTCRPGWNVHSDQHSSPLMNRPGFLLSKQSFDRRKSDKVLFPSLNAVEKSVCESPGRGSDPIPCDVPMSPELTLNWICSGSPECEAEADLDVMITPQQNNKTRSVLNVCEVSQNLNCDDLTSPAPTSALPASSVLISNPWDDDLIASLLAGLRTPLSSYTNLSTWPCCIPPITPKCSMQMGDECLCVDRVVGRGAFASVYQATNLNTSRKVVMKVQKPSNPWEFYINVQLNTRLEPGARHLYDQLHAAHLFDNGSVLIGELHNCGTLLDVINLYKNHNEKMPQPLVLYFTVCILDMVERLHATRIIHADIKPDNILLGDRFLENKDLSEENLEHGLVLIDFGQSIDMSLFPDGARFMARCMTSGFQCTEMLTGRPWTYQTDYFGVAGTVYCMLFGTYMQVQNDRGVWKTGGVFKRNPHSDLWQEFFHVLLNIPDCVSLPCLRFLHERLSAALLDNYSSKLLHHKAGLKTKILESRTSRR